MVSLVREPPQETMTIASANVSPTPTNMLAAVGAGTGRPPSRPRAQANVSALNSRSKRPEIGGTLCVGVSLDGKASRGFLATLPAAGVFRTCILSVKLVLPLTGRKSLLGLNPHVTPPGPRQAITTSPSKPPAL